MVANKPSVVNQHPMLQDGTLCSCKLRKASLYLPAVCGVLFCPRHRLLGHRGSREMKGTGCVTLVCTRAQD